MTAHRLSQIAACIFLLSVSASRAAEDTGRTTRAVSGWQVHINNALLDGTNSLLTERAMVLLKKQLDEIVRVVPPKATAELQKIPLWFSPEYKGIQARAEYHPGATWLQTHDRDPIMAKGVEFTNVRTFESSLQRMPNFALHELAHGYHNQILQNGFSNAEIRAAYEKARASGKYDKVERMDSKGNKHMSRHYGMTNPQEYFAESTEAFFSRNDFFPYDREQLKDFDPTIYALLAKLWGVDLASPAPSGEKEQSR